jgi:PAS domain S-box-containing protein
MIDNLPIRVKVTAIVMLTTAVALVVACAAFIGHEIFATHNTDERGLNILADVVASNSSAALIFRDAESAREILSAVRAQPSIIGAAIYASNGTVFVTYGEHSLMPLAELRKQPVSPWTNIETYRAIRVGGENAGTVHLISDYRFLRQRLKRDIAITGGILCCALVMALLVAVYLQRVVSEPLMRLAGAARQVRHEKNYAVRVGSGGGSPNDRDEIRAVIDAFDDMLAEVQRHQANLEENVASRTAELQSILNSAAEGIFGLDREGNVTFINPSGAALLGLRMQDLIGRRLHSLIHPEDAPEHACALAECPVCSAVDAAATPSRVTTFLRGDGTSVPVEITAATIDDPFGNATGVVVTFRDIADRLAIERMKDEFVSTVSHELRTPLTSIRGALTILGTGTMGSLNPKGMRMVNIAVSNTERLTRLINDVLDLEKLHAAVALQRRPLRIEQILAQAVEGVQPISERAMVWMQLQAEPGEIVADHDRIQQMLSNLLSNAIKFSPTDSPVDVRGTVCDGHYAITVRDYGRGIPEDKLELVFERFQQVDASDSRDKGGTGLGLAICRSIAEAHGGMIRASNAYGGGALFTVMLPLRAMKEEVA